MEPKRIYDLIPYLQQNYPNKPDLFASKYNNVWVKVSINEYDEKSNAVALGLLALGLAPGDKVASVSNNRFEWNFLDMGIVKAGMIHVPIYPTISAEEYTHILSHSEAKVLVVSDKFLFRKIKPIADKTPNILKVFTFDDVDDAENFSSLINSGLNAVNTDSLKKLSDIQAKITEDDLFTIIYTSGTTGLSKGVMLSHKNFMYQVRVLKHKVNINSSDRSLSFLPISHVLERVVIYVYQYLGVSTYYAEGLEKIADNLKEVQPNIFVTVPRVIERFYDRIIAKGKQLKGIKRSLFFWAVELGLKYELGNVNPLMKIQLKIANKLIFSKWREALGGNLKFIISGGAALQPRLAKIFWAAQIPIREGYGLTETAPVIGLNGETAQDAMIGTVGPKISDEQQVKIAEDGEILFKGPNLMLGYYKNPELTAEVIDSEGWFHTGDIGEIVNNKFIKITDRKKEIFKLSTGKYIAPQMIENILKQSFFIEQAMVVGENEKFPGALLSPNFEFLHNWASRKKISFNTNHDLISNSEVELRFRKEITEFNKLLGKTDEIKTFRLVGEQWTSATGELSPTLKLKRRQIYEKYNNLIAEMYKK